MAYGKRSCWSPIRELASAGIWWVYEAIGTPLDKAARAVVFVNNTDVDLWFSTIPAPKGIGNVDMVKLAPYSTSTWDIAIQRALGDKPLLIPVGTQFYVRCDWLNMPGADLWAAVECLIVESGS